MLKRVFWTLVWLALSILFTLWPKSWQPFLEKYYGDYIYPSIQFVLTKIPTPNSYALGDFLWIIVPVALLFRLGWLVRLYKDKSRRKTNAILFSEMILWLSFGYFIFMFLWGLNYHRESLYQKLKQQGYASVLTHEQWNFAREQTQITLDSLPETFDVCSEEAFSFPLGQPAALAHSAMAQADVEGWKAKKIKFSRWSKIYQKLAVAGVYLPVTGEPTVSAELFPTIQPFTALHEFAHWAGYAHETDADILAYWSAWSAPEPQWQYSGWLVWWAEADIPSDIDANLPITLKQGLMCLETFEKSQSRWAIRRLVWKLYNFNLKTQGIKQGILSYSLGEGAALNAYQQWLYPKREIPTVE